MPPGMATLHQTRTRPRAPAVAKTRRRWYRPTNGGQTMTDRTQGMAERVLAGTLLVGLAIGCVVVLLPFLSALLWGAILVFTTWPLFAWFRGHVRIGIRNR